MLTPKQIHNQLKQYPNKETIKNITNYYNIPKKTIAILTTNGTMLFHDITGAQLNKEGNQLKLYTQDPQQPQEETLTLEITILQFQQLNILNNH